MNYVKHEVIKFKRRNWLWKTTISRLLLICHRNGWMVVGYSNAAMFMVATGVYEKAKKSQSISIVDSDENAIIFLRDDLSVSKRLFSLAHEMGHIYLGHKVKDDKAEQEANLFAHYLLSL